MADVERFGSDLARAAIEVTDLVLVVGPDGRVEYLNPYGLELFGAPPGDDMVGAVLLDLVHPDDVVGVVSSLARMLNSDPRVPGRPARVRIRRSDGTFVRVEANGAAASVDGTPGRMVITARPTIDADLHDQVMHLLTSGAPSEQSLALVPALGEWRQPSLLHAVFVRDDEGAPLAFGHPALVGLGGLDDPEAPWADAVLLGDELLAPVRDFGPVAAARAHEAGVTFVRARPVPDALHRSYALVVMGRHETSALHDDVTTFEFSWFAMDKMAAVLDMALTWRHQAVELRRAASTDPLTRLANRAGFWTRFTEATEATAAAGEGSICVFCVDLDRFKPVNDTFGHAVGDALLVEVADRLERVVGPGDLVARVGGDEFTVVVTGIAGCAADKLAAAIVEELSEPYAVLGHDIEIGCCVGVSVAGASDLDADALLDAADRALYDAKNTGRNRWVRR